MSEATPEVRVGDRERRAVDDRLMAAVADGVLTLSEYDERSRELWRSRTRGDLDRLVVDLPSAAPAVPAPRAAAADRPPPHRVVAVMSEDRFAGALAPGQDVLGWAVMGRAVVDLRRDDLPDGVRVRVRSVMGEIEVQVPPGAVVHLSGLSVMGEREVRVTEAGAGPVVHVHVDAVAVMGTVQVTHGDGTVAGGGRRAHTPALHRPTSVVVPTRPAVRPRGGHVRRLLSGLAALLVPAAALGGVLVAGPDAAAVFGSSVEHVRAGQDSVAVSTLFGSVTVVVPNDVRVDSSGLVVFGSADCANACAAASSTGSSGVLEVRRVGAFGSIEVVIESEWNAQRADEARDEAEEDAEDAREQAEDD